MKITDLNTNDLPIRVKLTDGFTLDESFDTGTILQINSFEKEDEYDKGGWCYKIYVTALASDYPHNRLVAKHDWLDENSNPTQTIFEAEANYHKGKYNPEIDDWKEIIYVMENDNFFEMPIDKECKIINSKFSYVLEVDGKRVVFNGHDSAEYFKNHYESLGYKVKLADENN